MILKKVVYALLLPLVIFSQDFMRFDPHEPPPSKPAEIWELDTPFEKVEGNQILVPSLKGVRLVSDITLVRKSEPVSSRGIEIIELDVPGHPRDLQKCLSRFLEKPLTRQGLIELKREIILYFRNCNRPIIHVYIPEQNITLGSVQLVVFESKLSEIHLKGNCYFTNCTILNQIRSKPGCPINLECLVQDLDWLNRNPFRQVDAVFVPSVKEGHTDIDLVTCDVNPLRLFTGVENTGLDLTGHNRWFFGFNYGNLFNLGHLFSYQFTMGTYYNEFWAHSVNYTAPLCWRHTLTLFGGVSRIEAIQADNNTNAFEEINDMNDDSYMKTHGRSVQASARYEIPMYSVRDVLQDFVVGFDYKRTDTNLTEEGTPLVGDSVNITQFMLGYNLGSESKWIKNALTVELFFSPAKWLPDQTDSDFSTLRPGAKPRYVFGRGACTPIIQLPRCFSLEPILRFQFASENLLASEQLGLGGYNSVRGYEEREVNVDNGLIFNLNLKTPPLPLFSYFTKGKCPNEGMIFLLFFDLGYGYNHEIQAGEKKNFTLASVGPGVRYFFDRYVSVRGDWGFQLKHLSFSHRNYMFHFGIVVSY